MRKFVSDMTALDLIEQCSYPVQHRPESFPTYPKDPCGDNAAEFGTVRDFNGNYIMSGQNGICKLVADALNAFAEQHEIEVRERPKPKKGKQKR